MEGFHVSGRASESPEHTDPKASYRERMLFQLIHTVVTFFVVVVFTSLLGDVLNIQIQDSSNERFVQLRQGLESFAPLQVVASYFHALNWYETSIPFLNKVLDVRRTNEYKDCVNTTSREPPSRGQAAPTLEQLLVQRFGQRDRVSPQTRVLDPAVARALPLRFHDGCEQKAIQERAKYLRTVVNWFPLDISYGPVVVTAAFIDVIIYEFYTQPGPMLFAVYAQMVLGLVVTVAGLLIYKRSTIRSGNSIPGILLLTLVIVTSIFVGSVIAAVLQLCTLEIIFGAWFTAPYKIIDFFLHKGAEKWSGRVAEHFLSR
jgi:hypothetical protein